MSKIERVDSECDHSAIEDIEINLGRDDSARPPVSQLDGTVDSTDKDACGFKYQRDDHPFQSSVNDAGELILLNKVRFRCISDGTVRKKPQEKFTRHGYVYRDGEHLRNDTTKHYIATLIRILITAHC